MKVINKLLLLGGLLWIFLWTRPIYAADTLKIPGPAERRREMMEKMPMQPSPVVPKQKNKKSQPQSQPKSKGSGNWMGNLLDALNLGLQFARELRRDEPRFDLDAPYYLPPPPPYDPDAPWLDPDFPGYDPDAAYWFYRRRQLYGAADLAIVNLRLSSASIIQGQTVRASALVANYGGRPVFAARVGFFLNGRLVAPERLVSLTPGERTIVTVEIPFETAGLYRISVEVDPDDEIAEFNEANNRDWIFIKVEPARR